MESIFTYYGFESFENQIKRREMHLRRIELKEGIGSRRYREVKASIELQKKNYAKNRTVNHAV
jgi:hypothetical protein